MDFIEECYNKGFHQILEKIILSLPPETVTSCFDVSDLWNEMIRFYHNSKIPRIVNIQEERKSKEWRKKSCRIFAIDLKDFDISSIRCFHIAGDEREAVVAAKINQSKVSDHFVQSIHEFRGWGWVGE